MDIFEKGNKHLFEKWQIVDNFKRNASESDYYSNIEAALESQMNFGVKRITTFIDIDTVVGQKAINAALVSKRYSKHKYGIDLKVASQTLKGVLKKEERKVFEDNIEKFDIVCSLPRADDNIEKHLEYLMNICKDTKKKLHVHVDQLNTIMEKETELLARLTIKNGLTCNF